MDMFNEFLGAIEVPENREKLTEILEWVQQEFPELEPIVKWNQPMFADHGTYIIGFSVSKKHIAISPEVAGMKRFTEQIAAADYTQTNNIFRIGWDQDVDYPLLKEMISFNMLDKADAINFWR